MLTIADLKVKFVELERINKHIAENSEIMKQSGEAPDGVSVTITFLPNERVVSVEFSGRAPLVVSD
jgi:hypothetical protein